jgi:hypothetical protein
MTSSVQEFTWERGSEMTWSNLDTPIELHTLVSASIGIRVIYTSAWMILDD